MVITVARGGRGGFGGFLLLLKTKVLDGRKGDADAFLGGALDHGAALAAVEHEARAGGDVLVVEAAHDRLLAEDDAVLARENLGPAAGGLAVTLHDADIARGDEGLEIAVLADGGGGVALADGDHLEEIAVQPEIVADDDHLVLEGGEGLGVGADGLEQALAGDLRRRRGVGGMQGAQQRDEKEKGGTDHLRRSGIWA
ncbi:MAG: hypothetical protein IPN11_16670 [Opitutaceae bacterium]|nr:hypothetical protein [Opitutaceae bacterium]